MRNSQLNWTTSEADGPVAPPGRLLLRRALAPAVLAPLAVGVGLGAAQSGDALYLDPAGSIGLALILAFVLARLARVLEAGHVRRERDEKALVKEISRLHARDQATAREADRRERVRRALELGNQALVKESREKTEQIGAISLEIRTALSDVVGAVELMRETRLDARQRAFLATIDAAGDAALAVIGGADGWAGRSQHARPATAEPTGTERIDAGPTDARRASHDALVEQEDALPRGHVLLVEDDETNRIVLESMLERAGVSVEVARGGREAIDLVRFSRYDVIFMDCRMPEVDGLEVTRRIRAAEAADEHVPIIAVTAMSMPGDRDRCIAAGMDDYFTKPIRPEQLETVLDWLGS